MFIFFMHTSFFSPYFYCFYAFRRSSRVFMILPLLISNNLVFWLYYWIIVTYTYFRHYFFVKRQHFYSKITRNRRMEFASNESEHTFHNFLFIILRLVVKLQGIDSFECVLGLQYNCIMQLSNCPSWQGRVKKLDV